MIVHRDYAKDLNLQQRNLSIRGKKTLGVELFPIQLESASTPDIAGLKWLSCTFH
jgi:hypothetical protein